MKATGIVLTHSRHENIGLVVSSMLSQEFIDEVIVWNNNVEEPFVPPRWFSWTNSIEVVHSDANIFTLGRFEAMKVAKNDVIVTCDDDYLVTYWKELFDLWFVSMNKLVAATDDAQRLTRSPLLGWGSIFWKRQALEALGRYEERFGKDLLYVRKADWIFGLQERDAIVKVFNPIPLPGYNSSHALYRRKDHQSLSRKIMERMEEF